jgi:hypothetical protein
MSISSRQIKLLQVGKTKLGWSEAVWRTTLAELGGVTSVTELDRDGFDLILGFMEWRGFAPMEAADESWGAGLWQARRVCQLCATGTCPDSVARMDVRGRDGRAVERMVEPDLQDNAYPVSDCQGCAKGYRGLAQDEGARGLTGDKTAKGRRGNVPPFCIAPVFCPRKPLCRFGPPSPRKNP